MYPAYQKPAYTAGNIPQDVMARVATFFQAGQVIEEGEAAPRSAWLSSASVCRSWADGFLASSATWAWIVIGSVASLAESISRSRKELLTVKGDLSKGEEDDNVTKISMVMAQADRLYSLCISSSSTVLQRSHHPNTQAGILTPCLKVLDMTMQGPDRTDFFRWFTGSQLRALRINGFHFSDFSSLLNASLMTLTELSLINIDWKPDLNEMMDLLDQMPQLEKLNLDVAVNWVQIGNNGVNLPFLRELTLHHLGVAEANLIQLLDTPILERISFGIVPNFAMDYIMTAIHSKIIQVSTKTAFQAGGLRSEKPGGRLQYMLAEDVASLTCVEQRPGLTLVFDGWDIAGEEVVAHIISFYVGECGSEVRHLTVDNVSLHANSALQVWWDILLRMPTVETLEISGQHTSVFAAGLCVPAHTGAPFDPLFPTLKSVEFVSAWFRPYTDVAARDIDYHLITRLVKPYQFCENSQKTTSLTIAESINFGEYEVRLLRDIFTVDGVNWDGKQDLRNPDYRLEDATVKDGDEEEHDRSVEIDEGDLGGAGDEADAPVHRNGDENFSDASQSGIEDDSRYETDNEEDCGGPMLDGKRDLHDPDSPLDVVPVKGKGEDEDNTAVESGEGDLEDVGDDVDTTVSPDGGESVSDEVERSLDDNYGYEADNEEE
ncbi:hypothetical protein OE88DRAFT_1646237 [Heliocybe sulcata]|uniref:F-box domain-containing protein n=1 Tax=Heliocybe sulcata TaxID=5364 RepID=A0A5C3N7Q8_9AGAM|nr:hypothetical protein OE88DRAFT_1646237 [Heliocybe sulcata]